MSPLPKTPAGRFEFLLDLFAPLVEREDGSIERDSRFGIISREDFLRLLELETGARREDLVVT